MDFLKNAVGKAPFGFSYNEIIFNERGTPENYQCIYSNEFFNKIFNLELSQHENHNKSTPLNTFSYPHPSEIFYNCAVNNQKKEFEYYSSLLDRVYSVSVYSDKKGFFSCVYTDISEMKREADELSKVKSPNTEINKQKDLEKALQEKEEEYHKLIQNMGEGFGVVDPNEIFVLANPIAEEIFGVEKGELIGRQLSEFLLHGEYEKVLGHTALRMSGEASTYEFLLTRKNGEIRNVLITGTPLFDKDRNLKGTLGVFRDITARKQIEENLQLSEQRLSHALSATLDAIWEWNYKTGETYYSPRWYEMLGYNHNEFKMTFDTWKELCHPDDYQPAVEEINRNIKEISNTGYRIEFRMKHKSGTWIWVLGRGNVVKRDEDNLPFIISGTNTDITERKSVEEELKIRENKFRSIFNQMTEMVVLHEIVFDTENNPKDYRILDANPVYTEITGIDRSLICGRLGSEVYQSFPPPYLDEFIKVAITGEPYQFTTYYQPMDKFFQISVVSPQQNQFATITTDITEIKQFNDILVQKNKELENYLYVASHDLRSPLVNIQGFSARLKKQTEQICGYIEICDIHDENKKAILEILNEKIPISLNYIFASVTKMDALINSLLQISRTGRLIMNVENISLNRLFEKIIASFDYQLKEIDAKIIKEDVPDCFADETLLNQLFSNIIANAIKYRKKDCKLIIKISGKNHFKKVIACIEDNGIGIAKRHIDNIWNVFFRVDGNSEEAGEGIGLSIAKRIVDKHKGKIWVESEENVGSKFFVELSNESFNE